MADLKKKLSPLLTKKTSEKVDKAFGKGPKKMDIKIKKV